MGADDTLAYPDPPPSLVGRRFRPRHKLLATFVVLVTVVSICFFGYHALHYNEPFPQANYRKYLVDEIIAASPPPLRFAEMLAMTIILVFSLIYIVRKITIDEIEVLCADQICGIDWKASQICLRYESIESVDRYEKYILVKGQGQKCQILCWEWGISKSDRNLLYEYLQRLAEQNRPSGGRG